MRLLKLKSLRRRGSTNKVGQDNNLYTGGSERMVLSCCIVGDGDRAEMTIHNSLSDCASTSFDLKVYL